MIRKGSFAIALCVKIDIRNFDHYSMADDDECGS